MLANQIRANFKRSFIAGIISLAVYWIVFIILLVLSLTDKILKDYTIEYIIWIIGILGVSLVLVLIVFGFINLSQTEDELLQAKKIETVIYSVLLILIGGIPGIYGGIKSLTNLNKFKDIFKPSRK